MAQTLYLKYRPRDFDSVVGQEIARITLKNASKLGKLNHAYLFTGPRGTGKTSMARIVAKAINCMEPKEDGNPCNQCNICVGISEGRNVDIIEIDAASHTSVDDVRDLIDKARFMPNESKKKVYIVDEVHMLSKSAFNALLKTLEEPPEHVHFILATTESHKVPETIISRCQKFDFKRIEIKDIVYYLKYIAENEGITADIKALNLIAKISEGGMRNAIGLFEKVLIDKNIAYEQVTDALDITGLHLIEALYDDLDHKRIEAALAKIHDLYEGGASLGQFLKDFMEYLREKLLESIHNNDTPRSLSLLSIMELMEKAGAELKNALIPQLPLEIAVTRICLGSCTVSETRESAPQKTAAPKTSPKETEVPMKKEEEKPVAKAEKISEIPPSVDLPTLQEKWPVMCEMLPSKIRHAFKSATLSSLKDHQLILAVKSNTYLEIMNTTASKTEIENILHKTFGTRISVTITLDKTEAPKAEIAPTASTPEPSALSAEEAASLLGGDIVA